ncbi:MAG: ATP-dependent Clp protease proteolytic subunit [Myxococcales bacterium]|nr:ATP-dependent Clp protease proteolytic subunit [Myxococcales bacterium]
MSDEEEEESTPTTAAPSPFTPIDQLLFESRTVFISGQVNHELAQKVNRQLLALERADPDKPIVLWIDSPGGAVYSGFAIYDTAQFVSAPIVTVVAGMAWSMGSVISLCAEPEFRVALPNAKLLIHQPLISGTLRGSAADLAIHAADIVALKKKMHRLYAERTGGSVERFEELMDRDRWVEVDEAIELGLLSKIVHARRELDELLNRALES